MSFVAIHVERNLNLGRPGGHDNRDRRHSELLVQNHVSRGLVVNVYSLRYADCFRLADNELWYETALLTEQFAKVGNILGLVG